MKRFLKKLARFLMQIGIFEDRASKYLLRLAEDEACVSLTRENIVKIKLGMFWYEDDTCSANRILRKKLKAIVEKVDNNAIYGDFTISELYDVQERDLSWEEAKAYIETFACELKENEQVVWYDVEQLTEISRNYYLVSNAIKSLGKSAREGWQLSSSEYGKYTVWTVYFPNGSKGASTKNEVRIFRPALRKILD